MISVLSLLRLVLWPKYECFLDSSVLKECVFCCFWVECYVYVKSISSNINLRLMSSH